MGRQKSRSRSPAVSNRKPTAHLDRNKKSKNSIKDDELLSDSFRLPNKFKSGSSSGSILRATKSRRRQSDSESENDIDQEVNLNFKSNDDLDKKFGVKKPKPILRKRIHSPEKQNTRSRSVSPIPNKSKKLSVHDRLTLKKFEKESSQVHTASGLIYSKAAKETFKKA